MKIVDKVQFTLGVFDIVVGIGFTIAAIDLHMYTKIVSTLPPVGIGIWLLCQGIETRKQRHVKEKRIKEQAKALGREENQ